MKDLMKSRAFLIALLAVLALTGNLIHSSQAALTSNATSSNATTSNATRSLKGSAALEFLRDNDFEEFLSGGFMQEGKLTASDAANNDNLGFSVAISGNTAIVGAPADQVGSNTRQGSAYVFVRNGTTWTQQQRLSSSDGAANDEFGYSVAISADTVFIGRHNTQQLSNRTKGAVCIFTRTGTTWTQGPTLVGSDTVEGDLFGFSLAYDNGTLVVGAQLKNNNTTFFQGAAYVFTGTGSSYTQQAKLLANDGGFADFFGTSVGVSGDTAIVGAPGQAGSGADSGKGWAYVFVRSGTSWSQQQKLIASDGASGDAFGFSVAVSGNAAVVGARLDTIGAVGNQGSAYVFDRAGTVWTERQKLLGIEPIQRNDNFGYAVAIAGDTIAVGSPAHEYLPGIANHGAIYIFTKAGATWTRQQKMVHDDASSDALGQAVAFDGAAVIGGAPAKNTNRGAAYVFTLDPNGGDLLTQSDGGAQNKFGTRVVISGDTAVVSAPDDDVIDPNNNALDGSLHVYVRNAGVWTFQQRLITSDPTGSDQLGFGLALSGNTIVAGAPLQGNLKGAAYVFVRNGTTWTQQQKLTANDGATTDRFGWSVAVDGDTIIVGASTDSTSGSDQQGSAYVFTRSGTVWTQQTRLNSNPQKVGAQFGWSVALQGNTAIIGANTEDSKGAAYVFTGAGASWTQQARLADQQAVLGGIFGTSISISGNTVVIGCGMRANNRGAAFVYTGSGATWTEQQILTETDTSVGFDNFGETVTIDADAIVVGARSKAVRTNNDQGAGYVFTRSGNTWTQITRLTAFDGRSGDHLSNGASISGNTALLGAPDADHNGFNSGGAAYFFTISAIPTSTPTPTPTPTPSPSPSPSPTNLVQFTSLNFDAAEGVGPSSLVGLGSGEVALWEAAVAQSTGSAAITVSRTGDTTGAGSVDFATQDGTAKSRSDYTAAFGTLRFAAGETSKSIVVFITDDRFMETPESFSIVLSNPVGLGIGTPGTATINVTSDDAQNGPNPVNDASFDAEFFVRQHYADFLGREPDSSGLNFWKGQITECETFPAPERQGCRETRRINVSAAFFLSIEFQQTGYFVYLFHQAAFNTREQLQFATMLADGGEVRRGVVVGQGNWEQQLDANKTAFAIAFVSRPAFLAAYPVSMTPAQFVDALNVNTGGSLSQSERDARVAELSANNTTAGRGAVLRKIVEDSDFSAREFNRAFVLMQYFGYMRRNPNETPDTNFDGFNFWLGKLNQFGNFVDSEMVKAFITAGEYQQRFAP